MSQPRRLRRRSSPFAGMSNSLNQADAKCDRGGRGFILTVIELSDQCTARVCKGTSEAITFALMIIQY